ncbi:MAG: YlxR family protein [Chloroflexi bacterium]|nr:YlxR family protein [Chloroflexota bacterium]
MPQRTCVACRKMQNKRDLIRLVCSAEIIEIDPKGKKPGRGVYLCHYRGCWEAGLKGNRLEYTLHAGLSAENRQMLIEYGRSLPEKEDSL